MSHGPAGSTCVPESASAVKTLQNKALLTELMQHIMQISFHMRDRPCSTPAMLGIDLMFDSCCCCHCDHLTVQNSGCACLPAQQPCHCCPVLRNGQPCFSASNAGPVALNPISSCACLLAQQAPYGRLEQILQAWRAGYHDPIKVAASAMPCSAKLILTDPWSLHVHSLLSDLSCVGAPAERCPSALLRVRLAAHLDRFRVAGAHCALATLRLPAPSQTQPLAHTVLRPRLAPGAGSILLIMHHFLQHTGHMHSSRGQGTAHIAGPVPS